MQFWFLRGHVRISVIFLHLLPYIENKAQETSKPAQKDYPEKLYRFVSIG